MFTRPRRSLLTATTSAASAAGPLASAEVPAPAPIRPPGTPTEARCAAVRQSVWQIGRAHV